MPKSKSKHPHAPSDSTIGFAIEAVDAYSMAHEFVSEMSVIFESINKLIRTEANTLQVSLTLSRAGLWLASERLKLLDQKMARAELALEALSK